MPASQCPKCPNTTFELKPLEMHNSDFVYNAVQCRKCGAVAGVVEHHYAGNLLAQIMEKLGIARG
jgi:predicted nucleic-acid-binding Zn-ribbon protein